jgi:hypothetical protein
MLLAGDAGLSLPEARIQMSMWCMWSAPLLMSNDLRTIGSDFMDVLLNEEGSYRSTNIGMGYAIVLMQSALPLLTDAKGTCVCSALFSADFCAVIAIDQDSLGASAEGQLIVNNSNVMSAQVSVWHKPLRDGSRAVALLNTGLFDAATYNLTMTAEMIGLKKGTVFSARDLWARKDLGNFKGSAQFWLNPTDVVMLKVR